MNTHEADRMIDMVTVQTAATRALRWRAEKSMVCLGSGSSPDLRQPSVPWPSVIWLGVA